MLVGLSIERGLRRGKGPAAIEIGEGCLSTKQRAVVPLIFRKPSVEFVLLALVEGRGVATNRPAKRVFVIHCAGCHCPALSCDSSRKAVQCPARQVPAKSTSGPGAPVRPPCA